MVLSDNLVQLLKTKLNEIVRDSANDDQRRLYVIE